eukprot:XP_001697861.1 predicted protein [Chlamydomonas reinhardtii]
MLQSRASAQLSTGGAQCVNVRSACSASFYACSSHPETRVRTCSFASRAPTHAPAGVRSPDGEVQLVAAEVGVLQAGCGVGAVAGELRQTGWLGA